MAGNFLSRRNEVMADKEDAIERVLNHCGLLMERYAKLNLEDSPRRIDTGRLRNSVAYATAMKSGFEFVYQDNEGHTYSQKVGKVPKNEHTVYVGTNVEYAPYVHEGAPTVQPPNAFLKNAVANHREEYMKIIEDGLKGRM